MNGGDCRSGQAGRIRALADHPAAITSPLVHDYITIFKPISCCGLPTITGVGRGWRLGVREKFRLEKTIQELRLASLDQPSRINSIQTSQNTAPPKGLAWESFTQRPPLAREDWPRVFNSIMLVSNQSLQDLVFSLSSTSASSRVGEAVSRGKSRDKSRSSPLRRDFLDLDFLSDSPTGGAEKTERVSSRASISRGVFKGFTCVACLTPTEGV